MLSIKEPTQLHKQLEVERHYCFTPVTRNQFVVVGVGLNRDVQFGAPGWAPLDMDPSDADGKWSTDYGRNDCKRDEVPKKVLDARHLLNREVPDHDESVERTQNESQVCAVA